MIIKNYQLIREKQIEIKFENFNQLSPSQVLIRPKYLSICAADHRYFFAKRDKKILAQKLPMSLIHEAIGEVVMTNPDSDLKVGDWVTMVPNIPTEKHPTITENYLRTSKFRSSSMDGFMQEYSLLEESTVVKLPEVEEKKVYVFCELLSVVIHSLNKLNIPNHAKRIAIFGDGSLSYLTTLFLKMTRPELEVTVIGKYNEKLEYFQLADHTIELDDVNVENHYDIIIEAVGGKGSESAVDLGIDIIKPEGKILLLGVSEYGINVNTRMVLEKGLTLQGASRSGLVDFQSAVDFINSNESITHYLNLLIAVEDDINKIEDIETAFNHEANLFWGKAVMKWNI